ncbi:Hypothetical_protein [Hexamita inflata]|uniref:Hypothetical_protein n=1 Tax=Hexamita inflata TaxID=28002 RepID=A0AA86NLV8_9EUKA|nr:Hypothetical protein HINF_LOCUS10287 [Hexamita inflata]
MHLSKQLQLYYYLIIIFIQFASPDTYKTEHFFNKNGKSCVQKQLHARSLQILCLVEYKYKLLSITLIKDSRDAMLVEQPQVPKSYSRSVTMQSHKLWELKVYLNYFWIQIKEISIELDQITVIVLKYPILMYIIITQQKEIVGEDNNKYSCWCDMQYTVTIPDFMNFYFSYNKKMLKHCLKVVRCYINTKQKCHLYLSASSCFPLLKSFQLIRQICYNKEKTLKRYTEHKQNRLTFLIIIKRFVL